MNIVLDNILDNAIKNCDGKIPISEFSYIYPFTTENIARYINNFNLKGKSLLTVGSSGDQVINAILKGCENITLFDINEYSKYYYYLKISCLLCLELDEFMNFLRFKDYPNVFKDNQNVFDKNIYNKIKPTLRLLDYESYLFWDELFQTFDTLTIRERLFSCDEDRTYVIQKCNPYLIDDYEYKNARNKIKRVIPKFIYGDLLKINLNGNYDNIWLSNIGTYLPVNLTKALTDKVSGALNEDGQLLICYLYKTTKDSKYDGYWCPIYNLVSTLNIFSEYKPELISFTGVDGLKFNDDNIKDSIMVYRRTKK